MMNSFTKSGRNYIGYEYKEAFVPRDKVSMYLDAYECLGWIPDDTAQLPNLANYVGISGASNIGKTSIRLKRDRKIMNKAELTRLQRHFESCMEAVEELERMKTSAATMYAIGIGVIGTAFMAGSVFAVVAEPPIIWLCIVLAIPAITFWILPSFVYRAVAKKKTEEANELIEQKYDEIHEICEKGSSLL